MYSELQTVLKARPSPFDGASWVLKVVPCHEAYLDITNTIRINSRHVALLCHNQNDRKIVVLKNNMAKKKNKLKKGLISEIKVELKMII